MSLRERLNNYCMTSLHNLIRDFTEEVEEIEEKPTEQLTMKKLDILKSLQYIISLKKTRILFGFVFRLKNNVTRFSKRLSIVL